MHEFVLIISMLINPTATQVDDADYRIELRGFGSLEQCETVMNSVHDPKNPSYRKLDGEALPRHDYVFTCTQSIGK